MALKGLKVDMLLPWQQELIKICQNACDELLVQKAFEDATVFADTLLEPLIKKEFSPHDMNVIFDQITADLLRQHSIIISN